MATILTKKKDTTGAPVAGDLTNSSGGAELAVNTADKRLYTKDSGGNVVEVGTNPGTAVTFTAGTVSAPAITTTGDTNTGVFFPAADTIAFAEGGAEAMRINSDSQVVTTAGTASLPAITTSGDTNTGIFFPAADTIAFAEGGAEAARIDSGGNFGVGVTPSAWRSTIKAIQFGQSGSVYSNTNANAVVVASNDYVDSTSADKYIANGFATLYQQVNGQHQFYNAASGTAGNSISFTQAMTLDASGNLGIGTTSPGLPLHVNALNAFVRLTTTNDSSTSGIQFGDTSAADIGQIRYEHSDNSMRLFVNNAERARITSGGNLLVGHTTNPSNMKLFVNGGCEFTTSTSSNNTTGWAGVDLGTLGTINISRNGSNVMAFFHTSNASGLDGSAVGTISITTTATTYSTSSDYRLKENIAPMTGALATVAKLKPVTYTWKVNGSAGQGFIAHELQAVVPDCVTGEKDATEMRQVEVSPAVEATYDEDGNELTPAVEATYEEREVPKYQGVDTSFLVATLTAAIQELKAITDAQATRIEALEAEVAAMKAGNGN